MNTSFYRHVESIRQRGIAFFIGMSFDYLTRKFLFKILSNRNYVKWKSFIRLGYIANFSSPKTFNEKTLYRKFNLDLRVLAPYADKYKVRKVLTSKGFPEILNDLYQYIDSTQAIFYDKLPDSFVMKATHGSGMIKIIRYKKNSNKAEILQLADKWLKTKYNESVGGTEYHYDYIQPGVIFEKVLQNKDGSPLQDYKFYCFHGKVEYIVLVDNSGRIPLTYVFDKNWVQLPFALNNKTIKRNFKKPEKLLEMISISEELSKEFDFVRIDLYLIDDEKIIFGEYTFFPGGGMLRFVPRKYDLHYGTKLHLTLHENSN